MVKTNGNAIDKLPPQNIEAEKSLLGSLLLDKEAINRVADSLRPEDFYGRAHQLIYEGVAKLFEKREPIDLLSLSNVLEESGHLETIGGVGYLTALVNSVPTSAHVAHYGKIVQRKKVLRDLIDTAHHIIGLGYQEDEDVDVLLDQAEQKLFSISQRSVQQTFQPISAALRSTSATSAASGAGRCAFTPASKSGHESGIHSGRSNRFFASHAAVRCV